MRKAILNAVNDDPIDNIGLAYERYSPARGQSEEARKQSEEARKQHLMRCMASGSPAVYKQQYERWVEALNTIGAWTFEATLKSRMTIGLGVPSPYENGLMMNRTYGVPVVPGSSIKGALRSCAQDLLGIHENVDPSKGLDALTAKHGEEIKYLAETFGSTDAMAAVTVFDAWWKPVGKPVVLETMTPHHQKYMTQSATLPLETEDPIPLQLLAVPKGATFRFAILLPDPAWQPAIKPVIELALARGLGAKQSQGYGRFDTKDINVVPPTLPQARAQSKTVEELKELNLAVGRHTLPGMIKVIRKTVMVVVEGREITINNPEKWMEDGREVQVDVQIQRPDALPRSLPPSAVKKRQ